MLEDETRVLSERGVYEALDVSRGGAHSQGAELPRFAASNALNPYISADLAAALSSPIVFQRSQGGRPAHGYPATLLVEICNAVLEARDDDALTVRQATMAHRADLLMRGLATVGIVALVDEATGYQETRSRLALAAFLEKFIAKELQPWVKTFPDEFYAQIYRLRGWGTPHGHQHPSAVGGYTNDVVYDRFPGLLEMLQGLNPADSDGHRENKHHQWLTPEAGRIELGKRLEAVIALMRTSSDWPSFLHKLDCAYPKMGATIPLPLGL